MTSSLWAWLNVVEKLDMDVPYRPVIKTLSRSASVGNEPDGVLRHLNVPCRKSRGTGVVASEK